MEVLPFPVVRHVHNYLTAQIAVRQLVKDSVAGKSAAANRGLIQRDILARLARRPRRLPGVSRRER
jgi:hypothetical protein